MSLRTWWPLAVIWCAWVWYCYVTEVHAYDFVIKDFIIKRSVICTAFCIEEVWKFIRIIYIYLVYVHIDIEYVKYENVAKRQMMLCR